MDQAAGLRSDDFVFPSRMNDFIWERGSTLGSSMGLAWRHRTERFMGHCCSAGGHAAQRLRDAYRCRASP